MRQPVIFILFTVCQSSLLIMTRMKKYRGNWLINEVPDWVKNQILVIPVKCRKNKSLLVGGYQQYIHVKYCDHELDLFP